MKNLRVSVVGVVEHPLLLFKRPKILGNEQEPGKVARARANLAATGLGDLVDIREGDALETLKDVGGEVDLLLIDGAFSLYLPALKLVEPRLKPGAVVLRENAFEPEYLDYVRNPANGYDSQRLVRAAHNPADFTIDPAMLNP